jgi:hypothetical protein
MYGMTEANAQTQAVELARRNPQNRYAVAMHKHPETNIWGRGDRSVTWGVLCYVPYCEAMPYRLEGFVWFPRNFATLAN